MSTLRSGLLGGLDPVSAVLSTDTFLVNTRKVGDVVNTFTAEATAGQIVAAGFDNLDNVSIENLTVTQTFTMTGTMNANFNVGSFSFISTGSNDINFTPASGQDITINGNSLLGQAVLQAQSFN